MNKNYTEDFKKELVKCYQNGEQITAICQAHGIARSTCYRWIEQYGPVVSNRTAITLRELTLLERKITRLENIIAILRSASCTATAPLKEKLYELAALYGQYDVHTICEALDVSRGTFYNHMYRNKRDRAWYQKRREEYRVIIQEVFDEFHQIFGAEKIEAILRQRGHQISKEFVVGIMRELGLASIRTTSKQDYMKENELKRKRNVLDRRFNAEAPNMAWVSDVTCFKLKDHYYYICVILDLFSRKIVSHRVSKKNSTQLITTTFRQAFSERSPNEGLIFHSDRGAQYTSHSFQELLTQSGVAQSFSKPHHPHDNAVAESFFSSMKREALYRNNYRSESELRQGIDSYIAFYNTKRPHRSINNKTPCDFEKSFDFQGT